MFKLYVEQLLGQNVENGTSFTQQNEYNLFQQVRLFETPQNKEQVNRTIYLKSVLGGVMHLESVISADAGWGCGGIILPLVQTTF